MEAEMKSVRPACSLAVALPFVLSVATLSASAVFSSEASAAEIMSCPTSFTADGTAKVHDDTGDKNTASSACEYASPPDSSTTAKKETVNSFGFFGFTDWEDNPGNTNDDNELSGGAKSGVWSITDPDFSTYDYMITFKDGADTNLTSFFLNEVYSSGGWDTPFVNPPFTVGDQGKDVSHFAIFQRTGDDGPGSGVVQVPVPGTLGLLGGALLGLGLVTRRRFSRN
jgi:hypothetical protein